MVTTWKKTIERFCAGVEGKTQKNSNGDSSVSTGKNTDGLFRLWSYDSPLAITVIKDSTVYCLINEALEKYSATTSKQMGWLRYTAQRSGYVVLTVRFPANDTKDWSYRDIGDANTRFPTMGESYELINSKQS